MFIPAIVCLLNIKKTTVVNVLCQSVCLAVICRRVAPKIDIMLTTQCWLPEVMTIMFVCVILRLLSLIAKETDQSEHQFITKCR